MSKAVATDQREHPRLRLAPTIIRAEIERDGQNLEGYLINVSLGGAFLSMDEPPPDGATSELHVLLPWGVGECHVQAQSVWQQKDDLDRSIGAGIAFIDLTDDAKEKLRVYLQRFEKLSAEITD